MNYSTNDEGMKSSQNNSMVTAKNVFSDKRNEEEKKVPATQKPKSVSPPPQKVEKEEVKKQQTEVKNIPVKQDKPKVK